MPKWLKIQTKKAACRFRQAALFAFLTNFYSKLPLTCRILSHRPPPVTGIFAVNLPHNSYIKPPLPTFVKQKNLKIEFHEMCNHFQIGAL
jgi:hypothetical protein